MQKLKQVKITDLKKSFSLFSALKNRENKAKLPLLVDSQNQLLCSVNYVPDKVDEIYVFEITDIEESLDYILDFQQDLDRQKLSFSSKYFFYQNILQLYPDLSEEKVLNALAFPKQKKPILEFLKSLEQEERLLFFEKGISSFREAEYLQQLSNAGFKELFLSSKLKSKAFKLALNMAFELLKSDKLGSSKNYNPLSLEEELSKKRYPQFFNYLSDFKKEMQKLKTPSFLDIFTLPFFEAKKLLIKAELKNEQQFSELLQFFSKYQNQIKTLTQFLNEK